MTIIELAKEVTDWYRKYTRSKYFPRYEELERELSQKAISQGYLEMDNLAKIAE